MTKLTEAQRRALEAMPLEYSTWGTELFGPLPDGVRSRATLEALQRRGYAAHTAGAMQNVWHITDAGRAALSEAQKEEER